jgi:hypothetical protein
VHDLDIVDGLDGLADLPENPQTFADVEILFAAVIEKRRAFDVFHDEIRETFIGRPAVEKPRDERMIEIGEDLPLVSKAPENRVGVHAAFDELDGRLGSEDPVGALGQINGSHPAAADFLRDPVSADNAAAHRIEFLFGRLVFRVETLERGFDLGAQFGVPVADFRQVLFALVTGEINRGLKNRFNFLLSFLRHSVFR